MGIAVEDHAQKSGTLKCSHELGVGQRVADMEGGLHRGSTFDKIYKAGF